MADKGLLIVESPAKATTLKKYLGPKIDVIATVGHIKNLPKSKLGIDIDNGYQLQFVTIKGKEPVIKKIKSAAKRASEIYLAPDPDREGEAIADHIATEIGAGDKPVYRVSFNEITKRAVEAALKNRSTINQNLTRAQNARRALDRLVGYKLSPLLWEKVGKGLSAGRVQSAALRLIVEREREIEKFEEVEYWEIDGTFKLDDEPPFPARLIKVDGKKVDIKNKDQADKVAREIKESTPKIVSVIRSKKKRRPAPPYITSTLQRAASSALRYSAKFTMSVAQKLYEGVALDDSGPVGLISYMRTDSTRVASSAIEEARSHIESAFGSEYLPSKPNFYRGKKGAQDAHEAIRPTDPSRSPESLRGKLSASEFNLYRLIWTRFIASQMAPAEIDQTRVDIELGAHLARANGSIVRFDGFLRASAESRAAKKTNAKPKTSEQDDLGDGSEENRILPAGLEEGRAVALEKLDSTQKFTQPPPRYSEATLIKELEELGIGRPSTYAGIMSALSDRQYCSSVNRTLKPTDLGAVVTDLLTENFPRIINSSFTAEMEERLDQIADGKRDFESTLDEFYRPFADELELARKNMLDLKRSAEPTDITCPNCSKLMVIKFGRFGKFLACSGYPDCKTTRNLDADGKPTERPAEKEPIPTDIKCPKCSKMMLKKEGIYGEYLACSDYPKCKTTRSVGIGIDCPVDGCSGELTKKRSRRGKTFYSCSNYPKCAYALWDEPVNRVCPDCAWKTLIKKELKKGTFIRCPEKNCSFEEKVD